MPMHYEDDEEDTFPMMAKRKMMRAIESNNESDDLSLEQRLIGREEYFNAETFNDKRKILDVKKLVDGGALRITYPGDGKGGFNKDENPESFSVVSLVNDMASDTTTRGWPDKEKSIAAAQKIINGKEPDGTLWLSDGKYRQIVESAKALGMTNFYVKG